jgi:EAL domain-containing protein (putative c-di-GMP-specific phosphodiesterase class I)
MEFQPIIELKSGRVRGVEALARIDSTRIQSPDLWFRDAAAVGRLGELETLAATTAVSALDQLDPHLFLALNVSASMAVDARLGRLLDGVQLTRVVVELTEHASVQDYEQLRDVLRPLREEGMRLAIDDVGAGFSTMAHVLRLTPDIIKLDRSLVAGIEEDPCRQAFVRNMVHFARDTDAQLLAEGIETEAELEEMRRAGVGLGQGFLLARPGPLHAAALATI